ncbi:hypothetical protein MY4038_006634 [Beauveria bassiana]
MACAVIIYIGPWASRQQRCPAFAQILTLTLALIIFLFFFILFLFFFVFKPSSKPTKIITSFSFVTASVIASGLISISFPTVPSRFYHKALSSLKVSRDESIANVLTGTLLETSQEVPDFLEIYKPEVVPGKTIQFTTESGARHWRTKLASLVENLHGQFARRTRLLNKGDKSSRSSDEHVAATIKLIDLLNKRHATIHDPRAQHGPVAKLASLVENLHGQFARRTRLLNKGDKSSRSSDEHVAATIELIDLLNKRHATIHDPRAQHGPVAKLASLVENLHGQFARRCDNEHQRLGSNLIPALAKCDRPEVVPGKAIKIADFLKIYKPEVVPGKAIKIADFLKIYKPEVVPGKAIKIADFLKIYKPEVVPGKAIKIADFLKIYKPEVVPGKAIKIADFLKIYKPEVIPGKAIEIADFLEMYKPEVVPGKAIQFETESDTGEVGESGDA